MSTFLKRTRALFDDDDQGGDDHLEERNRCRFCGKFFVRLALHLRSCPQHDHSQILKDAQQVLADRQSARKRSKLVYLSNHHETAAQSGVVQGPGQCSRIETANDVEVRQNHSKISQNGVPTDLI